MQPSWYVHSSSNHYNTFISHSTFNQCSHLLCNRHGMFIRHLTIIGHSPVTLLLISVVICHTTIIVRSPVTPVTPLLISVVICHATVLLRSSITPLFISVSHLSCNRHSTFISHSTFNQHGHMSYNRHIRASVLLISHQYDHQSLHNHSTIICHKTVIVQSSVIQSSQCGHDSSYSRSAVRGNSGFFYSTIIIHAFIISMKLDKEAQIWKTVLLPVIRANWVCKPTPAVVTYQFGPLLINMLLIGVDQRALSHCPFSQPASASNLFSNLS